MIKALLGIAVFVGAVFAVSDARATPEQMQEKVKNSIVRIRTMKGSGGSGFVATTKSGKKVIVTNYHVCDEEGAKLAVEFQQEHIIYFERAFYIDKKNDLCLVTLSDQRHPTLWLGSTARPGQHIFIVGHPQLMDLTTTEGMAVQPVVVGVGYDGPCIEGDVEQRDFFTGSVYCGRMMQSMSVTAQAWPGNSGGPVLNDKGDVVGVLFASGALGSSILPLAALELLLATQ